MSLPDLAETRPALRAGDAARARAGLTGVAPSLGVARVPRPRGVSSSTFPPRSLPGRRVRRRAPTISNAQANDEQEKG